MRKCVKILFNSVLAVSTACILLFILCFYKGRCYPDHVTGIGKIKVMHMITGSMEPKINIGDIIIAKAIDAQNLKIGDIITFRTSRNVFVTHRIIDIEEDGSFITKGDANDTADIGPKVNKDNIIGRYLLKIPKGGYAIEILKDPAGIIFLISLCIGVFAEGEVGLNRPCDQPPIEAEDLGRVSSVLKL